MRLKHTHIRFRALATAGSVAAVVLLLATAAGATTPTGITGTVTNFNSATHEKVANAQVCVTPKAGGSTTCTATQSEGKYTIENLTPGEEYTVEFTGNVCVGLSCHEVFVKQSKPSGTLISGQLTKVDVELKEIDGKISGRVSSGGVPLQEINVCAFGSGFGCTTTNSAGEYTINYLAPGSYIVSFSPGEVCKAICMPTANYISQYWNNEQAFEAANSVTVKMSETTVGVNAELQVGGHISGKVTNASIYAQPLANVVVCANPTRTNKEGAREGEVICAITNASGEYTISALASGGYEVEFRGEVCLEVKGSSRCTHPYIAQFYQGIVSVSAPGVTSGINGSLLEASPTKPVNTAAPSVTTAQTLIATAHPLLSCSNGNWGNNPTSLAYRWLRNGTVIAGQTANTYAVQNADAGAGVACEVTASNAAGSTAALSNTVQIPRPPGVAVFRSASVKGSTVSITLRCTGSNACSGTLEILVLLSARHHKNKQARGAPIGKATFAIALGKSSTVHVHLTSNASKLLSRAGRKGLKVQITGSGVQPHTAVLKAKSKRHH